MRLLITLTLLGLNGISGDRCASVPPSMWCGSDELSKHCGFEDICVRYRTASHNKPINITVLMEALCPDCQRWIIGELYPKIFKNFAGFINIDFVPFGNARITNGSITCQHGAEECRINRFESCLIDAVHSQEQYVPLISCIENQLQSKVPFEKASAKCFRSLAVGEDVQRLIQSCMVSRVGERLQNEAAEKTVEYYTSPSDLLKINIALQKLFGWGKIAWRCAKNRSCHPQLNTGKPKKCKDVSFRTNIWPDKHTYVPWIIVNGISLKSQQTMMFNLPFLLCDWYTGDRKIPFCRSEEKKRRSKNSWID